LGKFNLNDIPSAPRGIPQIDVTFDIDANSILNVTAVDKSTNKTKNLTITNNKGRFTDADIKRMIDEAKKFEADDEKRKQAVNAKNELENYVHSLKQTISDPSVSLKLDPETKAKIESLYKETIIFLEANPNESQEVYDKKRRSIEDIWNPIAVKMNAQKATENSAKEPDPKSKPSEPTVEDVD